jgi:hypothetical protein
VEVPWSDVGDPRMIHFINAFLGDDRQARSLRLRERVRLSISAALYCTMFVKESRTVQDLAEKLVGKAVELLPAAREDVLRIVPELSKE